MIKVAREKLLGHIREHIKEGLRFDGRIAPYSRRWGSRGRQGRWWGAKAIRGYMGRQVTAMDKVDEANSLAAHE